MKSQSSLEFATTYGWAMIIIIAVVVTLLIYTTNNQEYDIECRLGPQFICNEVSLDSSGQLDIGFVNNINEDMILTAVNFSNLTVKCPALPITIRKGNKGRVQCNIVESYIEQEKETLDLDLIFSLKDSPEEFITRGEIITEVIPPNENFVIDCDEDNDGFDKYGCGLSNDCNDNDDTKWNSACSIAENCGVGNWECNNPNTCDAECINLCDIDGDEEESYATCGGNDCDDNDGDVWEAECYNDADCSTGYTCVYPGKCNMGCVSSSSSSGGGRLPIFEN